MNLEPCLLDKHTLHLHHSEGKDKERQKNSPYSIDVLWILNAIYQNIFQPNVAFIWIAAFQLTLKHTKMNRVVIFWCKNAWNVWIWLRSIWLWWLSDKCWSTEVTFAKLISHQTNQREVVRFEFHLKFFHRILITENFFKVLKSLEWKWFQISFYLKISNVFSELKEFETIESNSACIWLRGQLKIY